MDKYLPQFLTKKWDTEEAINKLLLSFIFSLQLCASVQIPKELGGLDAEALYIDTNTNFTISRFRGNMA